MILTSAETSTVKIWKEAIDLQASSVWSKQSLSASFSFSICASFNPGTILAWLNRVSSMRVPIYQKKLISQQSATGKTLPYYYELLIGYILFQTALFIVVYAFMIIFHDVCACNVNIDMKQKTWICIRYMYICLVLPIENSCAPLIRWSSAHLTLSWLAYFSASMAIFASRSRLCIYIYMYNHMYKFAYVCIIACVEVFIQIHPSTYLSFHPHGVKKYNASPVVLQAYGYISCLRFVSTTITNCQHNWNGYTNATAQ